jgi:hypothetical protein
MPVDDDLLQDGKNGRDEPVEAHHAHTDPVTLFGFFSSIMIFS